MSLIAKITDTGIEVPTYNDCLAYLQSQFKSIYGSDINIDPDTEDGQWLAALASVFNDANQLLAAVFRSFSPTYAQGTNLSSLVKINGIQRLISSNSQQNINVGGTIGTIITDGVVTDANNVRWDLPAVVIIPNSGTIVVTTVAEPEGAVSAVGPLKITTPTRGWSTATLNGTTVLGQPIETDAALRRRQALSTALPAQTPLAAIAANVANVPGVTRLKPYENATSSTDSNAIPSHSISLVVEGGDVTAIAQAIFDKKAPGVGTYGTTSENITDSAGVSHTIGFFSLTTRNLKMLVNITGLTGYVTTTGDDITESVVGYVNGLDIGEPSYLSRVYAPADLMGDAATTATGLVQPVLDVLSDTYKITSIYQALDNMTITGGPFAAGSTTVNVTVVTNFSNGEKIGIVLDNSTIHYTSITGIASSTLSLANAIPAGRSAQNGARVYTFGDVAVLFNEAAHSATTDITVTAS